MKPTLFIVNGLLAIFLLLKSAIAHENDPRATVLILYFSVDGHTQIMAEHVQAGAQSVGGVEVILKKIAAATTNDVLAADAVIVGSPVYNGNVAPQVQTFINSWPFQGRPLEKKLGAAFVSAGGISAGEETTQLSILRSMLMFGMVVVGGPDWTQAFGASAVVAEAPFQSKDQNIDQQFLAKGEALGRHVAELAIDWTKVLDTQ